MPRLKHFVFAFLPAMMLIPGLRQWVHQRLLAVYQHMLDGMGEIRFDPQTGLSEA